ncbi:uncharacterized protein LOC110115649 [Dendrobium catenatum]|uniref:Uncharacterized protein n=1 Tax=Dendrobium catenatum TaxID=906689 RepID=A0A2I0VSM8_9ASPA|nr:uncharacterized protein LOC110115649 [Dendrobium catenatum]PKU66408.1 hypothetical protein MA16_Dca009651 [Dendrobium catenatum]
MGKVIKTLRKSINAFLHFYHSLASIAAILIFPFSASVILSQSLSPSYFPILRTLYHRIRLLFEAAGFPATSQFFSLLNLKLSQTIFSFTATLPFTLTLLLLAKASVILIVKEFPYKRFTPPPFSSLLRLFSFLLPTHLFNSFIILSANAAFFSIIFLVFNVVDALYISSVNVILVLSAGSAILYSIVLANTMVVCNLAIVVAAMESCGGYLPILKACVLIRGREATAITLALPANLAMAAIEALFQYRIMKPWQNSRSFSVSVIWEAFSITYMHSLLIVIDVIINCMLYKSCRKSSRSSSWESGVHYHLELDPEEKEDLEA